MPQLFHKSKHRKQVQVFKSDLDFRVLVFAFDTPRGNYQCLGTTPGEIEIPLGCSLIVSPLDLTKEMLALYTKEISSQSVEAIYLSEVRDRDLLEAFCKNNGSIHHIVLDSCGWSLAPIETLVGLEFLEGPSYYFKQQCVFVRHPSIRQLGAVIAI